MTAKINENEIRKREVGWLQNKPTQIVFNLLLVVCICVGLVFFIQAHRSGAPFLDALEYFVPLGIVSVFMALSHFGGYLMLHDIQTWVFIGLVVFGLFLLIVWNSEKDPTKAGGWLAIATGVLGAAFGISIGGRLDKKK